MPNPLFDLAGIMCGQFGIPFWKFFLATLLGKAIIKTHIQVCHVPMNVHSESGPSCFSICQREKKFWEFLLVKLFWLLALIPPNCFVNVFYWRCGITIYENIMLLLVIDFLSFCFYFPLLQTVFIISVCNNQLLGWIENELIWVLSFIPGFASALPGLIAKLNGMKEKYLTASTPVTSNIKVL